MKNKEIFSKLQKHKERIIRQIEYRRLKRVRRKKLPNIPIVRIVVPNWTACILLIPIFALLLMLFFRKEKLYVASGICLASAFCIVDYLGGHADPFVTGLSSGCDLWTFMDLLLGI